MNVLRRTLYTALLNLIFSVLEVYAEYCYYVRSYYGYYYYECDSTSNGTRVTTIRTPHTGGTTVITQQQQQQGNLNNRGAPPQMMYGQYPQPGGVMYNQPPAYPPPQPNYPPPQQNYPPPQGSYPPPKY
ncbi:Hypothetical predicted protein [Mytilus galloprovincialis]|uniref:Uncharacterized protein n=1 Tax=Mytilus galloprovincialis TaxID=29158 RepID=A0A8B6GNS7_MYTGA|nr:Hypothetical predicted protein [Mytilus galloprovincialis]